MRTIQQPTILTGSLVLSEQEDMAALDSASLSTSCDSSKLLLGEDRDRDKLAARGPDIISHTDPLSSLGKHRRKIIAIPVESVSVMLLIGQYC